MTCAHVEYQGQRSGGSKVRLETARHDRIYYPVAKVAIGKQVYAVCAVLYADDVSLYRCAVLCHT